MRAVKPYIKSKEYKTRRIVFHLQNRSWQLAGVILTSLFGAIMLIYSIVDLFEADETQLAGYIFIIIVNLNILLLVGYSAFKTTFLKNVHTSPLIVKAGVGSAILYGPILLLIFILQPPKDIDVTLFFIIWGVIFIVSIFLLVYEIKARLNK